MCQYHLIISGASSVGKSTLVDECLKYFRREKRFRNEHFRRIDEVARKVLKQLKINGKDLEEFVQRGNLKKFCQIQEMIIDEQILAFENEKNVNYISDRSGFDALAFIDFYFDHQNESKRIFEKDLFQRLIIECRQSLIFIIQPEEDLKSVDDQMRIVSTYDEQMKFTNHLKFWFDKCRLPYFIITDLDVNKRIEFIGKHLDGHLKFHRNEILIPLTIPFHLRKPTNFNSIRSIQMIDQKSIRISYKKYDPNRLIEKYDRSSLNDKFLSISFDEKLDKTILEKILFNGIVINDQIYNFIGFSNSQLRSRSCYLYSASNENIEEILRDNGDFHQIKLLSKQSARIALLFSSGTPTIDIPPDRVVLIDDVQRNNFIFTDGCGFIGKKLAKELVRYLIDLNKPLISMKENDSIEEIYCPCAFQIRYQGYKGLLMMNNDDQDEKIYLRPSMKKFNGNISHCLYICDDGYSKPRLAFLIKQYLMLLSGLNIADEIFLNKQNEHFQEIRSIRDDMNIALKYSLLFDRIDLIYQLLQNNLSSIQSDLAILQRKALEGVDKLKIPITKSRLAFGACDPYGVLNEGEIYFRPTYNGRQLSLDSKKCFIGKSPSYHLGDIRIFRLKFYSELEYLYDVIIFPIRGRRPHPNEIAGSDLDGDKYFICWDEDLIPKENHRPMDYNSTVKSVELSSISQKDRISYFADAQQLNQSGLIDKYFNIWANRLGIRSIQCRRLAELFSSAIDAPKTGERIRIPSELRRTKNDEEEKNDRVWTKMIDRAKDFRERFQNEFLQKKDLSLLTKESLMKIFLQRRFPQLNQSNNIQSLDEFTLIISTINWINQQTNDDELIRQFSILFDLSQLTIEQKRMVELSLKIDRIDLYSTLRKSKILSSELIDKYHLDQMSLSWRLFYSSPKFFEIDSNDEFEEKFRPMNYLFQRRCLPLRTLINISIDETMTLVFDIFQDALLRIEEETKKNKTLFRIRSGFFNVYFESKFFSIRRKFSLDDNYFLSISDDRIQLYENDQRNSFVVFIFETNEEKKMISVDLTRFDRNILRERNHPKVNRQTFSYLEIFVLSNDQTISSDYYPIITFYDEEDLTENSRHSQIDLYQFVEYLTEDEKREEERFANEIKRRKDKFDELTKRFENREKENLVELIDELIFIDETKYLYQLWIDLSAQQSNLWPINEKILQFFFKEIHLMLKGSFIRPVFDEEWIDHLLFVSIVEENQMKYFHQIFDLIKQINLKLKDRSYPSYIPSLSNLILKLIQLNNEKINEQMNDERFYHLFVSLILGKNFNTNEFILNSIIKIISSMNISLKFKEILHLIQCCLMCDNGGIALKFIEYFLTIRISDEDEHSTTSINYIQQFFSILIRTTLYDLDEINRRTNIKKEFLIQNGETIFDLRAKLIRQKSSKIEIRTNDDDDEEEEEILPSIFQFEHYRYEKLVSHHFNIGDSVALIDQDEFEKCVEKKDERIPLRLFYQSFGIVQSLSPRLIIQFPYYPMSLTKQNPFNREKLFRLERLPNFVTLNRSIDALKKIIEKKDSIIIEPFLNLSEMINREQLKRYAEESINKLEEDFFTDFSYSHASLNESQRKAIENALVQRLTLIQGPPGTGKTETSVWIIHLFLQQFSPTNQTILVCAETHQAADNLTRRLLKYHYRLVRYGETRTVASDLHDYTMSKQIELLRREKLKSNPNGSTKSLFAPPKPKEIREILSNCQILCMTCSGVGILENSIKFPFILIDEASQITEPSILISLVRITKQIVLVGDEKQLPPIIKMTEAKALLERSFFQRLLEDLKLKSFLLDTQYRMHPSLIDFPSKFFYNDQLKSGVTAEQRPTPKEIRFINENIPLMFVDVDQGKEIIRGSNIFNPTEVQILTETIRTLLPRQRPNRLPSDIGVITPYTRQVKAIVESLSNNQIANGVEVRTVDGFQGREKEIILISLVRSNDDGQIGFLTNQQRMNVLLTRAKSAMIVFGNKSTLINDPLWNQWIRSVPNISSSKFIHDCLNREKQTKTIRNDRRRKENHH